MPPISNNYKSTPVVGLSIFLVFSWLALKRARSLFRFHRFQRHSVGQLLDHYFISKATHPLQIIRWNKRLQFWEPSHGHSTLIFACRSHSLLLRIFVTSQSRRGGRGLQYPPLCALPPKQSWIHPGLHCKSISCFPLSERPLLPQIWPIQSNPIQSEQFRVEGKPGYTLPVFRGGAHPVWGLTAIITLQVRHLFSWVFLFFEFSCFFSPVFASPSPGHCLSASTHLLLRPELPSAWPLRQDFHTGQCDRGNLENETDKRGNLEKGKNLKTRNIVNTNQNGRFFFTKEKQKSRRISILNSWKQ